MTEAVGSRELRRQIRQWRRGRADARLIDVVNDVYVAVFSTLLVGSMLVSVLINTGSLTAHACHGGPCESARFWAPWLVVVAAMSLTGALARLYGPVFVSAATASWLLTTPVRRRSLLVGPLLLVASVAATFMGAMALATTAMAGFGTGYVVTISLDTAMVGVALVGLWTLIQEAGARRTAVVLVWLPGLVLEAGLLLTWHGDLHAKGVPRSVEALGWITLAAIAAIAAIALTVAILRLEVIRNRDLAAGGRLGTALAGALAALDLSLIYDVVAEQRWRRRGHVRSRRGGPGGTAALVWLDAVRLWRSPSRVALVLAAAPIPYAARAIGAGRAAAPIAVLVGFLVAVPLLSGLRVLTRTPGLSRMLPFSPRRVQAASLVVPACCLLVYAALVAVAAPEPLAVALGALAAATRWMTGRPPDYGRPLVSTPAGAVPANLYGSVLRGFDVALLTGLPLLLPHGDGALPSEVLSGIVLIVLLNRRPAA
jgi:hypothetical protein